MMTRNILLVLVLLWGMQSVVAQKPNATYVITTTIPDSDQTGIFRSESDESDGPLYNSVIIYFMEQNGEAVVDFHHIDYNLTELAKLRPVDSDDSMEILVKPRSFLDSIQPVDIDQMVATDSEEDIWKWALSIKFKPIYLIDRNDFTQDSIKLIEVDVTPYGPGDIIIIEED